MNFLLNLSYLLTYLLTLYYFYLLSTTLVSSFFHIKNSGSQGIRDSGDNKIVFRDKGDYRIEYLIITYLFYPCYTHNGLR